MSRSGYWKSEPRTPSPFRALYPGQCAACPEPIKVGDPIAKRKNKYVHQACAETDDE